MLQRQDDESNAIETIKKSILTLYDHVHHNLRDAITLNEESAERVRLGQCM